MQAYRVSSFETSPHLETITPPQPHTGEVGIKIKACGLNFADILMQDGTYQDTPTPPFTLGMEVAGVVDALGPDTDGPAPGTRVAVFGGQGGLAEIGCFDVNRCVVIPDTMSFQDAAAFQIAYGTSHVALEYRAKLQAGETLLVLGAAGGVGMTAVELGKLMGARVIAVARGADKLAIAKQAGADHVIDATQGDLLAQLKALGGVDVVYDPVGGDQFKAAFRACRPEARIIVIGFASGSVPQIPANHLLVKNITVEGFYWGGYLKFKPHVITDSLAKLTGWYQEGKLTPHISATFPLAEAQKGIDLLKARKSTGKVVITID
jgi:NADPH2:quinone reductase